MGWRTRRLLDIGTELPLWGQKFTKVKTFPESWRGRLGMWSVEPSMWCGAIMRGCQEREDSGTGWGWQWTPRQRRNRQWLWSRRQPRTQNCPGLGDAEAAHVSPSSNSQSYLGTRTPGKERLSYKWASRAWHVAIWGNCCNVATGTTPATLPKLMKSRIHQPQDQYCRKG